MRKLPVPVKWALLGVVVAVAVLIVDLVALPLTRFGHSLFAVVDGTSNGDALAFALGVWALGAAVPVTAAILSRRSVERSSIEPWRWGLFGFGLPSVLSVGVVLVLGLETYSAGIVPDPAAEAPWQFIVSWAHYAGLAALVVTIALALWERKRTARAS